MRDGAFHGRVVLVRHMDLLLRAEKDLEGVATSGKRVDVNYCPVSVHRRRRPRRNLRIKAGRIGVEERAFADRCAVDLRAAGAAQEGRRAEASLVEQLRA